jgi:hypothetical protein
MRKKKVIPSLNMELYDGRWYVNGLVYVHLDAALEYAYKKLPTVPVVAVYIRDRNAGRAKVFLHTRKPSKFYAMVSERDTPQNLWSLFEAHVGMLS